MSVKPRITIEEELYRAFLLFAALLSFAGLVILFFRSGFQLTRNTILETLVWLTSDVILSVVLAKLLSHSLARRITTPLDHIKTVADVSATVRYEQRPADIQRYDHRYSETAELETSVEQLRNHAHTALADMRRLELVRTQFLGNVSHELRTPVFAIQGYIETLLDGAIDDAAVRRSFLEKAFSNSERLNTLLADLIDISRIESGEMRMSFRYFSIGDVLKDVLQTVEQRAEQQNIRIHTIGFEKEIDVFGDKERIYQVMLNLVTNAIKYNTPNGEVFINAVKAQHTVRIGVRDTGIGIAPEHQTRIFERFYRVDTNRSRAIGGTGLGLAIVKHILEAHASTISVESAPDTGTTITFTLKC